jgi:XRE family transcriptional regulator, aerobic/anaerobic benzoate catabolism transcriptional regulator
MSRRSSSPKKKKSSQSAFRKASVSARSNSKKSSMNSYLLQLGENIRSVRARRGMTIHQLARASKLSARFLTTVELGRGNISVGRLNTVAHALDVPIEMLAADAQPTSPAFNQSTAFLKKLPPDQLRDAHKFLLEKFGGVDSTSRLSRIALTGLRGAGKSTLGSLLAQQLGVPFIELDKQIERDSGVTLTIIFDLYGPSGYRRMERQALESILAKHPRFVLATGGSIVSDPAIYNLLLSECFTIWLRAKPEEHMARVLAQGDRRPMAHNRQAMRDLRRILWSREALYRQADTVLETTGQTIKDSLQALLRLAKPSP